MRRLVIFRKQDGEEYDCVYFPEEQLAQAIGPIPKPGGWAAPAIELHADSEEEALTKLIEALGPGHFSPFILKEDSSPSPGGAP